MEQSGMRRGSVVRRSVLLGTGTRSRTASSDSEESSGTGSAGGRPRVEPQSREVAGPRELRAPPSRENKKRARLTRYPTKRWQKLGLHTTKEAKEMQRNPAESESEQRRGNGN